MDDNSMMLRFYIGILHANLDIINKNKKPGKGTLEESRPEGSHMSQPFAEQRNKVGTQYKLSKHF